MGNARYLRVIEGNLQRLGTFEVIQSKSLAQVVKQILSTLHRVYLTGSYYKEPRMAPLLHKVLKVLVARANSSLTPPLEVGKPSDGFEEARQSAEQLRDGFQAFIANYFISEEATAANDKRPATTSGVRDGTRSARVSRNSHAKDDLGWWRATVRTSLEQAKHGRQFSASIATLLEGCERLSLSLPALQAQNAEYHIRAQSFLELHSGVRDCGPMSELLDLKSQIKTYAKLQEVDERLRPLLEAASFSLEQQSNINGDHGRSTGAPYGRNVGDPVLIRCEGGDVAEVLALPSDGEELRARPATSGELQQSIETLKEELETFAKQIENVGGAAARKAPVNSGYHFAPPKRGAAGSDANAAADEDADMSAALEIARRSNWYHEPPAAIPDDVPLIEVRQNITTTRTLHDSSYRPRTSQPRLFSGRLPEGLERPHTAPSQTTTGELMSPHDTPFCEESTVSIAKARAQPSIASDDADESPDDARCAAGDVAEACSTSAGANIGAFVSQGAAAENGDVEADHSDDCDGFFSTVRPMEWRVS